ESEARPARTDFTSGPVRTSPASKVSSMSKSWRALRLEATVRSPFTAPSVFVGRLPAPDRTFVTQPLLVTQGYRDVRTRKARRGSGAEPGCREPSDVEEAAHGEQ